MSQDVDRLLHPEQAVRPRTRPPAWVVALVVLAVLAVAVTAYWYFRPLDGPVPADAGARYADLEQTTTEEGFPSLGDPGAPVVVEVFSSFACPHCREFDEERVPNLLDEIAAGQVRYVYIPVSHIGQGAGEAAQAALCAGEQGRFWAMHDVLFYWQGKFLTQQFAPRRIEKGVAGLGLDANAFEACMDSGRPLAIIDRARQEFDRRGLRGTPTIFVDGEPIRDFAQLEGLGETQAAQG